MRSTSKRFPLFSFLVVLSIILMLSACGADNAGTRPHEEMHERLLPGGRPMGQPLSSRQPDVRVVRVESVHEADSIFLGLCLRFPVERMRYGGEEWRVCRLPEPYGGYICYTHRPLRGWRVVGTIYIRSPGLNGWGFSEIRFVETIKTRR